MALTITIDGKGVIANCDALTNDTGGTGTGDWEEVGGGSISLTTDTFLFGSSCIAGAYSNKSGWQQFTIGETLDFDTAGTEEGQHIFMWIHCPTIGLLETKANKGLAIRVATDASNYREYLIAGSDDANGWNGGWKCFVIDPTKTGSVSDTGTYDSGAITMLGVWIDAASIAKGDNIFIDQIAVGFGLRITGTSTTGWKDAVDYCTDYSNRAWGMLQEREGIYYAYGKIYIGDETNQSANVSFTDSGRIIQFGTSEYWGGSAWVTSMDIDTSGIVVEDHTNYTTTFGDGVVVGTEAGRSGSQIIGNSLLNVSMDFYGGNNSGSVTTLYNTTFKDITGTVGWGNDSDHRFFSGTINACSQFNPVGAVEIRNCIFSETTDADAAILWNENIDIQKCSFIANTTGAGIEHPSAAGTPYTHNNLTFSGNTYDVLNSSGSAITIQNTDSDGSTSEGASVTFTNSVDIKIYVKDENNNAIENAQVAVYKTSDDSQLMNEDTVAGTGLAEETFDYGAGPDVNVYIRVRKSSTGATKYFPLKTTGTITSGGLTTTIVLIEDKIVT